MLKRILQIIEQQLKDTLSNYGVSGIIEDYFVGMSLIIYVLPIDLILVAKREFTSETYQYSTGGVDYTGKAVRQSV